VALYEALFAHVAAAEARGVDLVWISERPFVPGARIPAALPLCAALAVRTTRVRLGAGPLALPLYHPLRVAEDAATLDGLSAGRIELALGLGGAGQAFTGFGVSSRGRGDRLEEGIALMRAAWSGEPVSFEGRHHTVSDVSISPRPVQQPGPPLWVGATAGAALRRAARLGAGLLATDVHGIEVFREERRALGLGGAARVALEREAGAALAGEGLDELARLIGAADGVETFDLVICAELPQGGGWLEARQLDALLELRLRLAARAGRR
jgi:alkanesulfonate monooxygenase SsuD/methylene tetrahydromethanopterin reductase-like flavin-dependent oxidoreductase (luciferase family)